jgi:hypothetical protein
MQHRSIVLLALLLSCGVYAQTAQTECHQTAPTAPPASRSVTCTTQVTPGIQAQPPPAATNSPPSFRDAFSQGQREALAEETLRLQTQLAAEQRRALENQQQKSSLSAQQIAAEAAVYRYAFAAALQEQWNLPEEKRLSGIDIAKKALIDANAALGYELHAEALDLASKQLESAMQKSSR